MRKLLFMAKWTYTNEKLRRFIRNFFNIRLTNKHMCIDETYVILGQKQKKKPKNQKNDPKKGKNKKYKKVNVISDFTNHKNLAPLHSI